MARSPYKLSGCELHGNYIKRGIFSSRQPPETNRALMRRDHIVFTNGARTLAHKCLRLATRSQKTRSEWWYLALCKFGKEFFEMHAKTRRMRKKLKTFRPTKAYRAKYVKAMLHYASQCQNDKDHRQDVVEFAPQRVRAVRWWEQVEAVGVCGRKPYAG